MELLSVAWRSLLFSWVYDSMTAWEHGQAVASMHEW